MPVLTSNPPLPPISPLHDHERVRSADSPAPRGVGRVPDHRKLRPAGAALGLLWLAGALLASPVHAAGLADGAAGSRQIRIELQEGRQHLGTLTLATSAGRTAQLRAEVGGSEYRIKAILHEDRGQSVLLAVGLERTVRPAQGRATFQELRTEVRMAPGKRILLGRLEGPGQAPLEIRLLVE